MTSASNPFKIRLFLRAVALATLFLFTFTSIAPSPNALAQTSTSNPKVPGGDPLSALTGQVLDGKIVIPPELGTVDEIYRAERGAGNGERNNENVSRLPLTVPRHDRMVVFIQDAHDSLEAQENIAKIIQHLVANYGVKTVFEEGYEGPVPTDDYFGFIKDPAIKQKVSYFFLDHLRIGGAEYAHINRTAYGVRSTAIEKDPLSAAPYAVRLTPSADWQLIGADSLKLHKENVDQYRLSAEKKDSISRDLRAFDKELRALSDRRFPKELKEWIKIKEQFDSKKLDLFTYLERTLPLVRSTEYGVQGAESSSTNSPYAVRRTPSLDIATPLLRFIVDAVKSNDPAVIEKAKHIDAREVFGELEKLEIAIVNDQLTDVTDRELYSHYKTVQLLKRLNELEVSQEEYSALRASVELGVRSLEQSSEHRTQNSELFNTQALGQFIHANANKPLVLSKQWGRNIQEAVKFYEIAQERDGALSEVLDKYLLNGRNAQRATVNENANTSNSELQTQNTKSAGTEPAILVYGGFHKENIKRLLEAKGISYVVVSPKITKPSRRHEDFYKKLMTDGMLPFEKMLGPATALTAEHVWVLPNGRGEVQAVSRALLENPAADLETLDRVVGVFKLDTGIPLGITPGTVIRAEAQSGKPVKSVSADASASTTDRHSKNSVSTTWVNKAWGYFIGTLLVLPGYMFAAGMGIGLTLLLFFRHKHLVSGPLLWPDSSSQLIWEFGLIFQIANFIHYFGHALFGTLAGAKTTIHILGDKLLSYRYRYQRIVYLLGGPLTNSLTGVGAYFLTGYLMVANPYIQQAIDIIIFWSMAMGIGALVPVSKHRGGGLIWTLLAQELQGTGDRSEGEGRRSEKRAEIKKMNEAMQAVYDKIFAAAEAAEDFDPTKVTTELMAEDSQAVSIEFVLKDQGAKDYQALLNGTRGIRKEIEGAINAQAGEIFWNAEEELHHVAFSPAKKFIPARDIPSAATTAATRQKAKRVFSRTPSFNIRWQGITMGANGVILLQGFVDSPGISRFRKALSKIFPKLQFPGVAEPNIVYVTLGRFNGPIGKVRYRALIDAVSKLRSLNLGSMRFRHADYFLVTLKKGNHVGQETKESLVGMDLAGKHRSEVTSTSNTSRTSPDSLDALSEMKVSEATREARVAFLRDFKAYLDWLSEGDVVSDDDPPDAALMAGNPDIENYLAFIEQWQRWYFLGYRVPVMLAGGQGRGTRAMYEAVRGYLESNHLSHVTMPEWSDTLEETDLFKVLLRAFNVAPGVSVHDAMKKEDLLHREEQGSKNTSQNFEYTKKAAQNVIAALPAREGKRRVLIVSRPDLLRRAALTAYNVWGHTEDWEMLRYNGRPVDVASASDTQLLNWLVYTVLGGKLENIASSNPQDPWIGEIRGIRDQARILKESTGLELYPQDAIRRGEELFLAAIASGTKFYHALQEDPAIEMVHDPRDGRFTVSTRAEAWDGDGADNRGARIPELWDTRENNKLREKLDAVLATSPYQAEGLLDFIKNDLGLDGPARSLRRSLNWRVEPEYLGWLWDHTLGVMKNFEKYGFPQKLSEIGRSDLLPLVRFALAVHDLGKIESFKEHHRESKKIVSLLMFRLGFEKPEIDFVCALIQGDPIGLLLQEGISFGEAYLQISEMAASAGLPIYDFFEILTFYYFVDASTWVGNLFVVPAGSLSLTLKRSDYTEPFFTLRDKIRTQNPARAETRFGKPPETDTNQNLSRNEARPARKQGEAPSLFPGNVLEPLREGFQHLFRLFEYRRLRRAEDPAIDQTMIPEILESHDRLIHDLLDRLDGGNPRVTYVYPAPGLDPSIARHRRVYPINRHSEDFDRAEAFIRKWLPATAETILKAYRANLVHRKALDLFDPSVYEPFMKEGRDPIVFVFKGFLGASPEVATGQERLKDTQEAMDFIFHRLLKPGDKVLILSARDAERIAAYDHGLQTMADVSFNGSQNNGLYVDGKELFFTNRILILMRPEGNRRGGLGQDSRFKTSEIKTDNGEASLTVDRGMSTREKKIRIAAVMGSVAVGLVVLQWTLHSLTGFDLWQTFRQAQKSPGWESAAIAAGISLVSGFSAQLCGMYLSTTATRRTPLVLTVMFGMQAVWRPVLGAYQAALNWFIDAHFSEPALRALVALALSIPLSALFDFFVPKFLGWIDAKVHLSQGNDAFAEEIRSDLVSRRQFWRVLDGVIARLASSFMQHAFVQNLFKLDLRPLILFGASFFTNTFRSRVASDKHSRIKTKRVVAVALAASVLCFVVSVTTGLTALFLTAVSAVYFYRRNGPSLLNGENVPSAGQESKTIRRAETRQHEQPQDTPEWLREVYKKAGVRERPSDDGGQHLGPVVVTRTSLLERIASALEIDKDRPMTLIVPGSGGLDFEIQLARKFPKLRIIAIEERENLNQRARKIVEAAAELGEINREQVVLEQGDFNDKRFQHYFQEADRMHYYEHGTTDSGRLVETLEVALTKPGVKIVTSDSALGPFSEGIPGVFDVGNGDLGDLLYVGFDGFMVGDDIRLFERNLSEVRPPKKTEWLETRLTIQGEPVIVKTGPKESPRGSITTHVTAKDHLGRISILFTGSELNQWNNFSPEDMHRLVVETIEQNPGDYKWKFFDFINNQPFWFSEGELHPTLQLPALVIIERIKTSPWDISVWPANQDVKNEITFRLPAGGLVDDLRVGSVAIKLAVDAGRPGNFRMSFSAVPSSRAKDKQDRFWQSDELECSGAHFQELLAKFLTEEHRLTDGGSSRYGEKLPPISVRLTFPTVRAEKRDETTPETDPFSREALLKVHERLKPYITRTPLVPLPSLDERTGQRVFIKDESRQSGAAFKARGVTYEVFQAIEDVILHNPELLKKGLKIVTQTDGNHGGAMIRAVTSAIQAFSVAYPDLAEDIRKIEPMIFTFRDVSPVKIEAMQKALEEYRELVGDAEDSKGMIDDRYRDYGDALAERQRYIAAQNGSAPGLARYMEHGGTEIMQGHATAAIEIVEQLREAGIRDEQKVCLMLPVGAGGPLGLAAAIKAFRPNTTVVMVQTPRYGAFVKSYYTGKMEQNDSSLDPFTVRIPVGGALTPFIYEDGIAVDGPEFKEALDIAQKYLDGALLADPERALNEGAPRMLRDMDAYYARQDGSEGVVGGTTAITVDALRNLGNVNEALLKAHHWDPAEYESQSEGARRVIREADVVVLFGTEGTLEPGIMDHTRRLAEAIGIRSEKRNGGTPVEGEGLEAQRKVLDRAGMTEISRDQFNSWMFKGGKIPDGAYFIQQGVKNNRAALSYGARQSARKMVFYGLPNNRTVALQNWIYVFGQGKHGEYATIYDLDRFVPYNGSIPQTTYVRRSQDVIAKDYLGVRNIIDASKGIPIPAGEQRIAVANILAGAKGIGTVTIESGDEKEQFVIPKAVMDAYRENTRTFSRRKAF